MSELEITVDQPTEVTVQSVLEAVLPVLPDQTYTPYQIATIVNLILADLEAKGLYDGKPIKPQQIYNYSTNGLVVKGSKRKGNHQYTLAEIQEFIVRFVNRKVDGEGMGQNNDLKDQVLKALNS